MSFAIKKLPAQKSFESGYFGIKAALLILKPALLILKCSLTPDTSGLPSSNNNSKKPRSSRRTGFLMTSSIVSHNPKTEDFKVLYK
jgi:hypothetical protein